MLLPTYFHVAPRYTCGSPAQVDHETFENVAQQELRSYQRGAGLTEENRGLEGIVYATTERGRFMYVEDRLTGTRYKVPLKWWGVEGNDRRTVSWHARRDRAQFRLSDTEVGTPYERSGQRYMAPAKS